MHSRRQQGISLLELLLVILAAAGMISLAITYYTQALIGSRVSEAVSLIQQINKASHEWLQISGGGGAYQPNFQSLMGIQKLTEYGLLDCPNNSCTQNPWNSAPNSTTAVGDYSTQFQYVLITLYNVPAPDCARLQNQMKNIAPQNPNTPIPNQNTCVSAGKAMNYQVRL